MNKKILIVAVVGLVVLTATSSATWILLARPDSEPTDDAVLVAEQEEPAGFTSNLQLTIADDNSGTVIRALVDTERLIFKVDVSSDSDAAGFDEQEVADAAARVPTYIQSEDGIYFWRQSYGNEYFFRSDPLPGGDCGRSLADALAEGSGPCLFRFDLSEMDEETDFLPSEEIFFYWYRLSIVLAAHQNGELQGDLVTLPIAGGDYELIVSDISTDSVRVPYPQDAIPFRDVMAYQYQSTGSTPYLRPNRNQPDDVYMQGYIDAWRIAKEGGHPFFAFDVPDDVEIDWALGTITWPEAEGEDGTRSKPMYEFYPIAETNLLERMVHDACSPRSEEGRGGQCTSPATINGVETGTSNHGVHYGTFFEDFTWEDDGRVIEDRIGPYVFIPLFVDNAMVFKAQDAYRAYPARVERDFQEVILPSLALKTMTADVPGFGFINVYDGDRIEIVEVFPGTPAAKAGLQSGDLLVQIDGEDVARRPLRYVSELIDDQSKSSITLGVLRRGGQELVTVNISGRITGDLGLPTNRKPEEVLREVTLYIDSEYSANKAAREIDRNFATGEPLTLHAYAFGRHVGSNPEGPWDRDEIWGVELQSRVATRIVVDPTRVDSDAFDIVVRAADPRIENADYFAENPATAAQYPAQPENFALYYSYKTTWRSYIGIGAGRYDLAPGDEAHYRISVDGIIPTVERR